MISLNSVSRNYRAQNTHPALIDVSLEIPTSGFTAISGTSGSGKSTLLHLIAGLDRPDSGDVVIDGVVVSSMVETEIANWRGRSVGLVFQAHLLLPTLTAAENVIAPMEFAGVIPRSKRRGKALGLLKDFGLEDEADRLPSQLSGGQQQRVAVARALACDAPLILADEPTGNLDTASAAIVIEALRKIASSGRTVVMVTHDQAAAAIADRQIRLADGRLIGGDKV